MKFFRNLNHKNEKKYTTWNEKNMQLGKFIGSQINLLKISNGDSRVLNDDCSVKNMNEMKMNMK